MRPLIFFIHVPKTASSTVNAVMKGHIPNGRGHVEAILADDGKFRRAANDLDWMSGHVSRDKIEARIREFTDRPVRFFACVRHATAQLVSHYNWLLINDGQFDEDSHLGRITSAMRNNGLTPDGVVRTLTQFPDLLNFQTDFLLGRGFEGDDDAFRAALARRFELIAVDPDEAASAMLGRRTITMRRDNVASYAFDPAIFYKNKVLDFLAERNRKDETVYRVVSTLRGGAGPAAAVHSNQSK